MSETVTKTIEFPFGTTIGTDGSELTTSLFSHNVKAGGGFKTSMVAYEIDFSSTAEIFFGATRGNITVTGVDINFWYNSPDARKPIKEIEFVSITSQPSQLSAGNLLSNISDGALYSSLALSENTKFYITTSLGDDVLATLTTAIQSAAWFAVGIRRASVSTNEEGSVDMGGTTLVDGWGWPWEDAGSNVTSPPTLTITYTDSQSADITRFSFRYTTSDPTDSTGQQTPRNSLGGYVAPNSIYNETTLTLPFDKNDTNITLDSLPTTASGLVQVGPEVIKYNSKNITNSQLTNLTRNISPNASFPAGTVPAKETVRFLDIDDLFEGDGTTDLVQYRCIAVIHNNEENVYVDDVQIYLLQDPGSQVQVDVGIEVSAFDVHTGTLAAELTTTATTFTSISSDIIGEASGFFDGGHIVFDPAGSALSAIIESFDVSGGIASFIIDRTLSSTLAAGASFRINPGPAQTTTNDTVAPLENDDLFFGFLGDESSNSIGFSDIRENVSRMYPNDAFYIWIKRTFPQNVGLSADTGAVLVVQYDDSFKLSQS